MSDIEIYNVLRDKIISCFDNEKQALYRLTHGGCYWFADIICRNIPNSRLVLCKYLQHCGVEIDGKIYDAIGVIHQKGFYVADDKNIAYMQKHFKPNFDVKVIERDLYNEF